MRICILSFTGLNTDGSDATRILKEMRSLAEAGYDVKAIGLKLRADLPDVEDYYGVEIRRVKTVIRFDRKLQRELKKGSILGSIRRLYTLVFTNTIASTLALTRVAWKEDADVYHCFGAYSLVPGFLVKIFKRRRVIYDSYEPAPTLVARIRSLGMFARILGGMVEFAENRMVSRIDGVLTIPSASDFLGSRFRKHNRNTLVLANVPEQDFGSQDGGSDHEMALPDGKKLFYMGALTRDKGMIKMVETLPIVKREFEDIRLVVAGTFSEDKVYDNPLDEVMSLIAKHDLRDNVVFLGFIPRDRIFRCMAGMDMVLQLYQPIAWFTESKASSSFFEYMAASLPIVTSDFPGFRSIIEEDECGLTVDPTDPEDVAAKVIYLLRNPEIARRLGDNGRRAFETKYNWGIEKAKLLDFYSDLERKLN